MSFRKVHNAISTYENINVNFWHCTKNASSAMTIHLYGLDQNLTFDSVKESLGNNHWGIRKKLTLINRDAAVNNGRNNFFMCRDPFSRFISMYKDMTIKRPQRGIKAKIDPGWSPYELAVYLNNTPEEKSDIHFVSQYSFINPKNVATVLSINDNCASYTLNGANTTINIVHMEDITNTWKQEIPMLTNKAHETSGDEIILDKKTKNLIYARYKKDFDFFKY